MRHVSHLLKTAAEVSVFDSKMDEVLTRVQRLFQMAVKAVKTGGKFLDFCQTNSEWEFFLEQILVVYKAS